MKLIYNAYLPAIEGTDKKLKVTVNGTDKITTLSPEQTVITLDPVNRGDSISISLSVDSGEYSNDISFIAGDVLPVRASFEHIAAKLVDEVADDVAPPVVETPVVPPEPVVEPIITINTEPEPEPDPT